MLAALYIAIILCIVVITAGIFNAPIVQPVYADYWSGAQTQLNVSMWQDMSNNVTNIRDVMLPVNISMAIRASSLNITALSGNGTVVMNNGTTVPWYSLPTSYTQIISTGGSTSLNFTTPAAGSYLIEVDLRGNTSVTTPNMGANFTSFALCDANNNVIVTNSERMGSRVTDTGNFTATAWHFTWIYTNNTGSSEVGICGMISQAQTGRYGIASDSIGRSTLMWVKLP